VNLSCGNCKAIQPFYGDPPKCDVAAGCVELKSNFGIVWTDWVMPEKQRLAEDYRVNQGQVFVEPKPLGCDFDDAPLGNKHCHYEKVVDVEHAVKRSR
jgi:hypothetical protein